MEEVEEEDEEEEEEEEEPLRLVMDTSKEFNWCSTVLFKTVVCFLAINAKTSFNKITLRIFKGFTTSSGSKTLKCANIFKSLLCSKTKHRSNNGAIKLQKRSMLVVFCVFTNRDNTQCE